MVPVHEIDLVYPMLAGVTPESQLSNLLNTLYKNTAERFRSHLATGLVGIPIITEWCIKNQQSQLHAPNVEKA